MALLLPCVSAIASDATPLPAPSRTVYKCIIDGKTTYSDDPCVGARRVDVEPTRGINKITGRERIGTDVAHEKRRDDLANAVKPITGLTPQQFETQGRRMKLSAEAQRECRELDRQIAQAERDEKTAVRVDIDLVDQRLYALRKRYRGIDC